MKGIMIGRSAHDHPLVAGAVLGRNCEICTKALQLTPGGADKLAMTGKEFTLLCEGCGKAIAAQLQASGAAIELQATRTAMGQIGKRTDLADWFLSNPVRCTHCGATISSPTEAGKHACKGASKQP